MASKLNYNASQHFVRVFKLSKELFLYLTFLDNGEKDTFHIFTRDTENIPRSKIIAECDDKNKVKIVQLDGYKISFVDFDNDELSEDHSLLVKKLLQDLDKSYSISALMPYFTNNGKKLVAHIAVSNHLGKLSSNYDGRMLDPNVAIHWYYDHIDDSLDLFKQSLRDLFSTLPKTLEPIEINSKEKEKVLTEKTTTETNGKKAMASV
jgi:hypothetical protein